MSLDGSFTCTSALDRFLARCPKLQKNRVLQSLAQKGDALTEEEVVNSLPELILHPDYTIPLIGCFAPLVQRIVEKSVSLLRLVPNLTSNSANEDDCVEVGDDEVNVIEFYIRSGRALKLHEIACLAFSRALDLAPFLLRSVLSYFSFAPPPFQYLLAMGSVLMLSEKDIHYLLYTTRISFRFLLIDSEVFSVLWDWSCFLDLVNLSTNAGLGDETELLRNILDIRWCGVQVLSIAMKVSDRATSHFGLEPETALTCYNRWTEFSQDVAIEKAGMYLESCGLGMRRSLEGPTNFGQDYSLQSLGHRSVFVSSSKPHETHFVRRVCQKSTCDRKSIKCPFVLTSAMKKSFEIVSLAVSQKWPILLHGPSGAGKTALINKLAEVTGHEVLFLHMDEQMDSKALVGSYICTEQPGEFRWQPGSLTQALLNGFWVVFEDIDKAPSEIHSILLSLLEGGSTYMTGHGESINVAEGFRLFATISSSKHDFSHGAGSVILSSLWRKVMVGSPKDEDLIDILNVWYPSLESLSGKLIDTLKEVNSVISSQFGGFQIHTSCLVGVFSRFSLRDLLKWCRRITARDLNFSGRSLLVEDCKSIYREAVDIFVASTASLDYRAFLMREIAKMWGLPTTEAETLYPPNKPTIQSLPFDLQVGRVTLKCNRAAESFLPQRKVFVELHCSLHILERIACSVKYNEPVLLVGETGTGKTTLVQNLATRLRQPLTVLNLSQQSDVADLLGGFKPTNARFVCIPLYEEFKDLFSKSYSKKVNGRILSEVAKSVSGRKWKELLIQFQAVVKRHKKRTCEWREYGCGTKRKRPLGEDILQRWESFSASVQTALNQIQASMMPFSFVEGAFIAALRNGHWILLDEINLAPPETLQRIVGVLEGEEGTLCLAERGDVGYINRHPNFRIFACMNPATDAGKKDLPYSVKSRFTEYFVDDVLSDDDLTLFVAQYMDGVHHNREIVGRIVNFYKKIKIESQRKLQDGANQKPQFSLRSLSRALGYAKKAKNKFEFDRALYDGFCMFFLTLLDEPSAKLMNGWIVHGLLGGRMPRDVDFRHYVMGKQEPNGVPMNYVLTRSISEQLRNLARAVFIKRYPVLLQGPTSSGKTSLVQYLAAFTGNEFVRINNHEHTDLQEYFGTYVPDSQGNLKFQEGPLVKAVRSGHWVVLDELNLAPSDVLEALNRLLDDNRELFVPELLETVLAHPNFMLFATQNPPTFYGGRKMLSRAFRNRFLEIHVDEIPKDELITILEERCKIPESYAKKMVDVMKDLQLHRQSSKVFAGKHGFMTPRDLFRWADRSRVFGGFYEGLAKDGYYLLADRLRDESEKNVVHEILEKHLRTTLRRDDLYLEKSAGAVAVMGLSECLGVIENPGNIIWTTSMLRLYFLIERCYRLREPVLLVGETGGGKTTVCQSLSIAMGSKLHILNCHQHTETSDFLGGFYPLRDRSRLAEEFKYLVEQLKLSKVFVHFPGDAIVSSDIESASSTIDSLNIIINNYTKSLLPHLNVTNKEIDDFEHAVRDLVHLQQKWQAIFEWQDGPLVQAMKNGDMFLIDEISLADDSVLERLNSILEPEKKLTLAEKGGPVLEEITAHPNFFLLATMNPGGDYGKKELSPALRNRFTEIWVPPVSNLSELRSIAVARLQNSELSCIVDSMLNFWEWFNQLQTGRLLTVRDLLAWVSFINATESTLGINLSFIHGVFLVLLDGLSLGTGVSMHDARNLREKCLTYLVDQLQAGDANIVDLEFSKIDNYGWGQTGENRGKDSHNVHSDHLFGIDPFYILKGDKSCKQGDFEFLAPTTCRNAMRVLRAMQLQKPVLLEGSPGVGKTSLVTAIAEFSGHNVVRINLSEQTDIMDLLGSDLPVESEKGMKFAWSDGILLQALRSGSWVLLDELNLAPQSVLEGLNAILDHRAEVYIPELGLTFKCPPSFRVFACQNPSSQGCGRKGLPKSFLNRFIKVYVDELVEDDYLFICSSLYPSIPRSLLSKLIHFNSRLYEDTMVLHKYGQDGSPWEFNLRDVLRSCQMIEGATERSKVDCFLSTVYVQRMRTVTDRREVINLFEEVFEVKPFMNTYPRVKVNPQYLTVGTAFGERNFIQPTKTMKSQLNILPSVGHSLEATLHCVQHQWLCILVGPSSSGKTSIVRLLAQLTGNILHEINLSSGTDISELLGCFEQYSAFRHLRTVIGQVEGYVNEYFGLLSEYSLEALARQRKDLISRWFSFLSTTNYGSSISGFDSMFAEHWTSRSHDLLYLLVEIMEQLKLDVEKYQLPMSWSCTDMNRSMETILKLQENAQTQLFSAKFEWVAGGLIKAIESGEWVLLENANLCNPTILDRINSLVEPAGSITVNECGLVDGKPLVLSAHRKFRLFLTVDPRHGEVSRAMRNRGVEVYMMPPHWVLEGSNSKEAEDIELKRFLVISGIPVSGLVNSMVQAHLYARERGSVLGVNITLRELTYWVQLFQQLLQTGSRPVWALHLSWEHIYLSSLGEGEGREIVDHAKSTFLSHQSEKIQSLSNFQSLGLDSLLGCSLSLPGGWPTPLKLRNFVWFSREACIRQNCQYLEYLGAQCAAYNVSGGNNKHYGVHKLLPSIIPVHMLHHLLYPSSNHQSFEEAQRTTSGMELLNKMLLFAANWTIEQATEGDVLMYISWLKWYNSKLEPYCSFFKYFLTILEQERDHLIWKCLINCWREITSSLQINDEMHPIPLLSMELVELAAPNDDLETPKRLLYNAIQSIGLLQLSFRQWWMEDNYVGSGIYPFLILPMLKPLRRLEVDILNVIVDSACFNLLSQLYAQLIEHHNLLWNNYTSSQKDRVVISWRWLKKDVVKLRDICPDAVESFLVEVRELEKESFCSFNSPKSMLWIYGGHPIMPSSASAYFKMQQLLGFCDSVWPTVMRYQKQITNEIDGRIDITLSRNIELKYLAMQGVCMSSYITSKGGVEDADIIHQLEDIYRMLLERFEREKHCLEGVMVGKTRIPEENSIPTCCDFGLEVLCSNVGLDSWLEILPLLDNKSFALDIHLLYELSESIPVDPEEPYSALSSVIELLKYALDFSLNFSSRPPTDFLSHQKILWILDAWPSSESVSTKISCFVHEMWFKWHSSLWMQTQRQSKIFLQHERNHSGVPCFLFQPLITTTLDQILCSQSTPIKDYPVNCLKVRVASGNLWQDAPLRRNLPNILLSLGQSLFQQIIFAHKKSFEHNKFKKIKSIFRSIKKNSITPEKLHILQLLIESSSHSGLTSLVKSCVEPLLKELYYASSSQDFLYNLGNAWLHIANLRIHLLLQHEDPDPALKYALKYSNLVEKIYMLELEIKVRDECDNLAGRNSARDDQRERRRTLENLKMEQKRLQKKLVFRPDPAKYEKLRYECIDFLTMVKSSFTLAKTIKCGEKDLQLLIDEACNWQETSTCFINGLSEEYASYNDLIQPVQIAVCEMKLGLSLVVSSAPQKAFLCQAEEENVDKILDTIYSFVQFPRCIASGPISVDLDTMLPEWRTSDVDVSEHVLAVDINLLNKLVSVPHRSSPPDKVVSGLQLQASIHQNILDRISHHLYTSSLMDKPSFMLLSTIFEQFARLWVTMKSQIRTKHDDESQQFKFKSRVFKIEDILKVDVSSLRKLASDGSLPSEWQEILAEEDSAEVVPAKEDENLEEEWKLIEESVLKGIVHVHNQLFGSNNLVDHPGVFQVTDEDRLRSFMDSYEVSKTIIKDLPVLLSSSVDANVMPEHLLCLCIEYSKKFGSSNQVNHVYSFYKDPNSLILSKMVKPLTILQDRLLSMLKDSPEHPDLQKISNILELLLALPLDSPLAKALLGLQFLVSRVQSLQENGSKFSLSDQLQPILLLISSWQRLETECWPALLDGVLQQYEINATKLWFPLYSVLHRKSSGETDSNCISTIQSLEDFVQTASIGEFKKRLELLVAFHGEFNTSKLLELSLSPQLMANLKILYNVLGYYIQFLPLISECIEAIRKSSEKDLKELSKLSRWEVTNCYSKSTRQKLWKLVQKFNDVLQQPVMSVLNLEEMQKRIIEVPTLLEAKVLDDAHDKVEMSASAIDLSQFGGADRSLHFDAWRKKIDSLSQDIFQGLVKFDFFKGKVAKNIVQSLSSISVCEIYVGGWRDERGSLKMICETASQCAYLWKHGTKNLRKRMALADLLKTLERSGLSRHISRISEVDLGPNQLSSCFLEPSYEVCHLLMSGSSSFGDVNVNVSSHIKKIPLENFDRIWETTNQYYYKNISMLQLIQQIRLNFHKDLTLEQVNRSTSFLNHLVRIQQEQRAVAYGFSEQLKRLRKQAFSLKMFGTINSKKCSIIPEQHATHICMWQQKRLFDSLSNTSIEASLLLRMVKNTHLDACKNVEAEANNILLLIEKFIPKLQNSKESLDRCLLGNSGIIITQVACRPFIVSEDMKQLVVENFQVLSDFEEDLQSLEQQTSQRRCVQEHLLSRFRSLIDKGKRMKEVFHSEDASTVLPFINIHSSFIATSEDAVKHIMSALEKIGSLSNCRSEASLAKNITSWKGLFVSCIDGLQMDLIFDLVERTIIFAGKFVNRCGSTQPDLCLSVEVLLKDLHVLLDLILTFGESLLFELVAMHKIVAEMTHMLANVFAALYLRGFGASESDQVDDADGDKTKEASGTGMGEGEGLNDVSNQIEDEEQLLGTSEKPSEGIDDSNEVPNKKDKGIEMEEDFAGDTFSVSEDSGDDEGQEEGEDVNPESVMGEGSNDKEIVDEKLWDKEEDGKPDNPTEKFEVGPSVRETETNSKELRAKDETEPNEDESGILNNDQSDQVGQDDENADAGSDEDRYDEDMKMDKAEAFEAPSGIEVDEQNQDFKDDMDIAEQEEDTIEEADPDPNEDEGTCDEDRKADQMDDQMDGADSGPLDENNEADGPHNEQENAVTDSLEVGKETIESGSEDPTDDAMLSADSVKPMDVAHATDSIQKPEICWSNISDLQNGLVSSGGLHSNDVTKMELSMPDSSKEGDVTADQPNVRSPPHSSSSVQRARANPFRSIGDALEEWKERIHISSDPVEQKAEGHDEVEDKNAEEYRYVTELEEGTSQALGPATSEQIDKNVKGNKFNEPDADHPDQGEDPAQMDIEKESETHQMKKCMNAAVRQKISEKIQDQVGPTNPLTIEEAMEITGLPINQSEDLVAVNNSFFTKDEMLQVGKLSMYDQKLEKVADMEITTEDAAADWRRYELDTSRLSQELAEQLRLVMEPTLANKLQGDYKTGKRINMKKVIPYIASHFRKDKIWLRRTRPNKRDYQVVVAIDDSRSMSESGCGEFARKALVTVCRAMSQLEVGQLAVASFGEKGKVRLLHDFHHPFSTEVGVKMVRSLEFKQENRIADAPIADLLKYLNSKLDASVASARLPSGQNPLQQLILIIGDGLLHEQSENVKAYVTEALSRNRMVAFIVLDSSIVDLQVFSLGSSLLGTSLSATKYLDSFPFPFYIVLKNIEALPRTLADLLRQWFELMQTARD